MATKKEMKIKEVKNIIDDHFLDVVGNDFKFDHVKGMAEWLKNSVDAYRRNDFKAEEHHVIFRFLDEGMTRPIIEAIDFVGMTSVDIEKSFKRWGDPNAAKRGNKTNKKMFGGHGNGGKFYMRQMFKQSRFITYKEGLMNVFGFSENRMYGFAEGFEDKKMKPKEALEYAEIANIVPTDLKNKILNGETGFTLVQGIGPEGVKGKFKVVREIERLKDHPQSRRILLRSNVAVIHNDEILYPRLQPSELEPLEMFAEPRVIQVPEKLTTISSGEKVTVTLANQKYPSGKLVLRTSVDAMSKGTILGELNRIDILGEVGVIGSYPLYELVNSFPAAAFIYGDFGPAIENDASILEDPDNDCVTNDRAKLAVNETTKALLEWIASEVDKLAGEIMALEREKQKANQKDITSKFNDVLNEWKNKHMNKIMSDVFGEGQGGGRGNNDLRPKPETIILPPPNGFDFKYPRAEIEVGKSTNLTLKVNVPQVLPVGATVFASSDSEKVKVEQEKHHIKSEFIKTDESGQDIAFINIAVVGTEVGAEVTITATDKKHTSTMVVVVIPEKEGNKGNSFPKVLLSGYDADPLSQSGDTVTLSERESMVYQRPQDVSANIYWINTSSKMASIILDKFKSESPQWRQYLFDRYVDIFVKEAIHNLAKKDFENFNADTVDREIEKVIRIVHQSAAADLEHFLFDQTYLIPASSEKKAIKQ